uniref:Uncharacterized protein n=1 Tax=Arundo donax TaxID=35708 RepID=A0A0A9B1J6_ARUDO
MEKLTKEENLQVLQVF